MLFMNIVYKTDSSASDENYLESGWINQHPYIVYRYTYQSVCPADYFYPK